MEHLAGLCAGSEQRVIAEDLRVAVGGALLLLAVHFADRRVDVDRHRCRTWTSPHRPGPSEQRLGEAVELADMADMAEVKLTGPP